MARTTIRIDDPVLRDLKLLQRRERKPLGRLVSELLAEALGRRHAAARVSEPPFVWHSQPMGFKIDLEDKDAVWALLDREDLAE
ncbi:MAG: antitoxin [Gemmatimonadetes bacterium]|nr:antitoxin [Gemmatimonadota bacterium]